LEDNSYEKLGNVRHHQAGGDERELRELRELRRENPMDKSRATDQDVLYLRHNLGTNFLGPPRLKSGALDHPRESGQGNRK